MFSQNSSSSIVFGSSRFVIMNMLNCKFSFMEEVCEKFTCFFKLFSVSHLVLRLPLLVNAGY